MCMSVPSGPSSKEGVLLYFSLFTFGLLHIWFLEVWARNVNTLGSNPAVGVTRDLKCIYCRFSSVPSSKVLCPRLLPMLAG